MLRKLSKSQPRKTQISDYQNLINLQKKYMWQSFVIIKQFFGGGAGGVHSNFTHDSKANDFMKFYFEILLEILVPSLLLIDYCLSQL